MVILEGPHGAGKTSLCQRLQERGVLSDYVSLLSESTRRLAETDAEAFVGIGETRIDRLELVRTFRYLATLTGQILNQESASRELDLNSQTFARYLDILENLMLVERIPAFHSHERIAARRRTKIHVVDTALATWALRVSDAELTSGSDQFGPLLESFVVGELIAQAATGENDIVITHWRDPSGRAEVDLVMSDREGRSIPVEIKAGATIREDWTKGIEAFRRKFHDTVHRGIIFYGGNELARLGHEISAVPIAMLWGGRSGRGFDQKPSVGGLD
ncbi:MAG: DUF4143 domain-containing protein [Acidimicrobiales bacterium]